jgi:hypothetical protein
MSHSTAMGKNIFLPVRNIEYEYIARFISFEKNNTALTAIYMQPTTTKAHV